MYEKTSARLENADLFSALALPAAVRLRKKIVENERSVWVTVVLLVTVLSATSILKGQAPILYPVLTQFFPNAAALALVVGICLFPKHPTLYALLAFVPGFAVTVVLSMTLGPQDGVEMSSDPLRFLTLSLIFNLGLGLILGHSARMVFHNTDTLFPGASPDVTLIGGVFLVIGVIGGLSTYIANVQVPLLMGFPPDPGWRQAAFIAALRVMRGGLIAAAITAIIVQPAIKLRDLPSIGLGLSGFGLLIVVQHHMPSISSEVLPLVFALVLRIVMKLQVAVLTALLGLVGNAVIAEPELGNSLSGYIVSSFAMCLLVICDMVLLTRRSKERLRDRNIGRLLVSQEVSRIGFFLYLPESGTLIVDGPGRSILGLSKACGLQAFLARIDPEKRAQLTQILTAHSGTVVEFNTLLQPHSPEEAPRMVRLYFQYSLASVERPAVFGSIVDVSMQYETERALKSEKALQERLFAVISHEMRSPASITQILAEKLIQSPDQTPEIAPRIARLNKHLLTIMEDVRLVMRPEETARLSVEPVRLAPMMRAMCDDFAVLAERHQMQVDLRLGTDGDLVLDLDPTRLRQVIGNLVRNAILHSHGSQVVIETAVMPQDGGKVLLQIDVKDDGCGIPEALRPSLFEPFSRAKVGVFSEAEGTGLGMYIIQSLVHRMGGDLTLMPPAQGGTHIRLCLPSALSQQGLLCPEAASVASTGALAGKSVLLVEDSPLLAELTAERIRLTSARVTIASTAEAALALLSIDPPDLVVTDQNLPGQDGTEFVKTLRAKGYQGKIFSLSGDASDQTAQAFIAAGVDAVMLKPFSMQQFIRLTSKTRHIR